MRTCKRLTMRKTSQTQIVTKIDAQYLNDQQYKKLEGASGINQL